MHMQHVNKPQENVMRRAFTQYHFAVWFFAISLEVYFGQCKIDEEIRRYNFFFLHFPVCQSTTRPG